MQGLGVLPGPDGSVRNGGPAAVGGRTLTRDVTTPADLRNQLPLPPAVVAGVDAARHETRAVLDGEDDRLLVIVGPCSVHDIGAALDYAARLSRLAASLSDELLIQMRVYVEKPRTTIGWPGLLADPSLDGTCDFDTGLRQARDLMVQVARMGLPVATEWLSPAAPGYLGDVVSWGAVGARTVESQVHRQLASGLPMPIGMKNGTSGSVRVAIDAIRAAGAPHAWVGPGLDRAPAVNRTTGNPDCHVVLRGAAGAPNYAAEQVRAAAEQLAAAGLPTGVVIDASHGNSGKDHLRQAVVAGEIGVQVAGGVPEIRGVMLEGFLAAGRQDLGAGEPVYGQSITDACMGWDVTEAVLHQLADAVRARRGVLLAAG
jgi:3-deoxy-7-phosphoheptulonate synthase